MIAIRLAFTSPDKIIAKLKVESGVTPPGASANEQANIRLSKFHDGHAVGCLAGLKMIQSY